MSNNPNTGENQALEPPVNTPGSPAADFSANWAEKLLSRSGLEVRVNVARKSPCSGSQQDIASEVQKSAGSIPDEKLGRDSSPNFLQGPLDFDERKFFCYLTDEGRLTKA